MFLDDTKERQIAVITLGKLRVGDLSSPENIKITNDYLGNETEKAVNRLHSYTRSEHVETDDEYDLHKYQTGLLDFFSQVVGISVARKRMDIPINTQVTDNHREPLKDLLGEIRYLESANGKIEDRAKEANLHFDFTAQGEMSTVFTPIKENISHNLIRGTGLEAQLTKSANESYQQRHLEEDARER